MKKALKIGGVVLGIILVAALVIFIFFPGIFTYFKVKHKYSHINDSLSKFESLVVPDAFDGFTLNGIKLKMPYGSERQVNDIVYSDGSKKPIASNIIRYKDKITILIKKSSFSEMRKIHEQTSELLESYDTEEDFSDDEYKHYFDSIDESMPRNSTERIWYNKNKLKASDCLRLRGKDMEVFKYLAECKDAAYDAEITYIKDIPGCDCYVSQNLLEEYKGNLWSVFIYPENDEDTYYYIMIRGNDEETIKQIISSIEL